MYVVGVLHIMHTRTIYIIHEHTPMYYNVPIVMTLYYVFFIIHVHEIISRLYAILYRWITLKHGAPSVRVRYYYNAVPIHA